MLDQLLWGVKGSPYDSHYFNEKLSFKTKNGVENKFYQGYDYVFENHDIQYIMYLTANLKGVFMKK